MTFSKRKKWLCLLLGVFLIPSGIFYTYHFSVIAIGNTLNYHIIEQHFPRFLKVDAFNRIMADGSHKAVIQAIDKASDSGFYDNEVYDASIEKLELKEFTVYAVILAAIGDIKPTRKILENAEWTLANTQLSSFHEDLLEAFVDILSKEDNKNLMADEPPMEQEPILHHSVDKND